MNRSLTRRSSTLLVQREVLKPSSLPHLHTKRKGVDCLTDAGTLGTPPVESNR